MKPVAGNHSISADHAAQDPERVASLRAVAEKHGLEFFEISGVTGQGLDKLKWAMAARVLSPEAEG